MYLTPYFIYVKYSISFFNARKKKLMLEWNFDKFTTFILSIHHELVSYLFQFKKKVNKQYKK